MPQYKFIHAYPNSPFKAGQIVSEDEITKAGLSPNVLAKDGFVEVDGKSLVASTSYAPNNPAAVSPAAAASPAKPADAIQFDH